jgi:FkbM family methyltransferase
MIISLGSIIKTIRTTRNFWDVFLLKFLRGRRKIMFKNGKMIELDINEYVLLREAFAKGYSVDREKSALFTIRDGKFKIIGSLQAIDIYVNEFGGEMYKCECRNKIVLDIGGFYGESAVFFYSQGAKKVIIYEPVVAHHNSIKRNILWNGINAELHDEGIGKEDGYQTIRYETIDYSLGILGKGKHTMKIKIKNVAKVIKESEANLAKFDCEGAEENLIDVPNEILRKIDFYMIECHTPKITRAIERKFNEAGFKLAKKNEVVVGKEFMLHFQKI